LLMLKWMLFIAIFLGWFTLAQRATKNAAAHEQVLVNDTNMQAITIGKLLFYDNRLSYNGTRSCASCHSPEFAFGDNYRRAIGAEGDIMPYNSKPLFNLANKTYFGWANPKLTKVEQAIAHALLGTPKPEMGFNAIYLQSLNKAIITDTNYQTIAPNLQFKNSNEIIEYLKKYIYTFKSSKHQPLNTEDEVAGKNLFHSNKLGCTTCHSGGSLDVSWSSNPNIIYSNIGSVSNSKKTDELSGLAFFTKKKTDIGKYKIPSLLNVGITAPYFHDGRFSSLYDVIKFYEDATVFPDHRLNKFSLTEKERQQLVSYLYSLTDSSLIKQ
jgi:cytochrome c peroxidase